jgi:membrane protein DedA with SNARE-associated domain/membrane-associated phospholipid phosphatase
LEWITNWIDQYGYISLFLGLCLELIAFPIPTEVLMSYAGFLVYEGKLGWIPSILAAGIGSMVGITISYLIGYRLGAPFFQKYGHRVHLGPERLDKVSRWFKKFGNKMLIIGYFIPGVRHITGYFSGITRISYRAFAVYAYAGALIWTSVFISLGKVLGPQWKEYHENIKKYLVIGGVILVMLIACYYLFRKYQTTLYKTVDEVLDRALKMFHSFGRVKFLVLATTMIFLLLFAFMLGLIQDYLANEFTQFDAIARFLVQAMFTGVGVQWTNGIVKLASFKTLFIVAGLTGLWIWFKGQERWLEIRFTLFSWLGGEVVEEVLRRLFHRMGPEHVQYTFPSEQVFMVMAVYGFSTYLLLRHSTKAWGRVIAPVLILIAIGLIGLNRIYLDVQYPSDVVAGFVFGGVWLSSNMILLEIYRHLGKKTPKDKKKSICESFLKTKVRDG